MSMLKELPDADTCLVSYEPLISPTALLDELPLSEEAAWRILKELPVTAPCLDTYEPLISPTALLDELPLSEEAAASVKRSRDEVRAVLDRKSVASAKAVGHQ